MTPRPLALWLSVVLAWPSPALRPPSRLCGTPGRPPAALPLGVTASLFLPWVGAPLPWAADVENDRGSPALRVPSVEGRAKVGLEEALNKAGAEEPPPSKQLSDYARDDFKHGTVLLRAVPKSVVNDRTSNRPVGVVVRVQAPSDGRGFDGFIPRSLASRYGDADNGLIQLMDALRQDPSPVSLVVVGNEVARDGQGRWKLFLTFRVVDSREPPTEERPHAESAVLAERLVSLEQVGVGDPVIVVVATQGDREWLGYRQETPDLPVVIPAAEIPPGFGAQLVRNAQGRLIVDGWVTAKDAAHGRLLVTLYPPHPVSFNAWKQYFPTLGDQTIRFEMHRSHGNRVIWQALAAHAARAAQASAWMSEVDVLRRRGDLDAAHQRVERVLVEQPQNLHARQLAEALAEERRAIRKAVTLSGRGQFEEALALLAQLDQQYPKNSMRLAAMAGVRNRLTQHSEALALAQEAIQLNPENPAAYIAYVRALDGLVRGAGSVITARDRAMLNKALSLVQADSSARAIASRLLRATPSRAESPASPAPFPRPRSSASPSRHQGQVARNGSDDDKREALRGLTDEDHEAFRGIFTDDDQSSAGAEEFADKFIRDQIQAVLAECAAANRRSSARAGAEEGLVVAAEPLGGDWAIPTALPVLLTALDLEEQAALLEILMAAMQHQIPLDAEPWQRGDETYKYMVNEVGVGKRMTPAMQSAMQALLEGLVQRAYDPNQVIEALRRGVAMAGQVEAVEANEWPERALPELAKALVAQAGRFVQERHELVIIHLADEGSPGSVFTGAEEPQATGREFLEAIDAALGDAEPDRAGLEQLDAVALHQLVSSL